MDTDDNDGIPPRPKVRPPMLTAMEPDYLEPNNVDTDGDGVMDVNDSDDEVTAADGQ
ncbi:MAG: hypothetical protein R2867_43775 [Caldilineaceae bacterium]